MIKPLETIPQTQKTHWKTYRQKIREDIQEALDRGISKFEFVGDEYNYRTLASTVREEADRMNRTMVSDVIRKADGPEEHYVYSVYELKNVFPIHISSIKGEKEKERRVFCEIDSMDDFKDRVLCELNAVLKAKQERRERNRRLNALLRDQKG